MVSSEAVPLPLYWENKANNFNAVDISIPAAVTVFPGEIYRAPRSWCERAYHKLIYFHEVDKGGHFAAWEQPDLFAAEIREAFRPLRQPGTGGWRVRRARHPPRTRTPAGHSRTLARISSHRE